MALEAADEVEGRDPRRDPEFFWTGFGGSCIDSDAGTRRLDEPLELLAEGAAE
jgi:hypothetical protein